MMDSLPGPTPGPAAPQPPSPNDPLSRLRAALDGRYEVEREIGRGGMATVYLARDLRHGRAVAIKVLHPELASAVTAGRFLLEIRTAAQLVHPHVVTLFDSGEADGLLYYTMPYVEGESLAERLARDGALPPEEAVRVGTEVAEALAYAHERGVVHRDVKPANILLPDHGHACLADFGLAHALSTASSQRLTATGFAVGSPLYMAPEQVTGSGRVDARADQYGLGCVLYEMLTGRAPFEGETLESVLMQHLTRPPPRVRSLAPGISPALEEVVERSLAKAPADRYASAAELGAALRVAADGARGRSRRARFRLAAMTPPRAHWVWLGPLLALPVLVSLALARLQPTSGSDSAAVRVAVLPVEGAGGSGAGLQRLLARSLESLPELRAIAATAPDDARYLLTAELLPGTPAGVAAELVLVETGERVYRGMAEPGAPLDRSLDRLGLEAARAIARREGIRVPASLALASSSAALAHLRDGDVRFHRGEVEGAVTAYHRAVQADSTFGLAYYRLSMAETWGPRWNYRDALRAVEAGLGHGPAMPSVAVRLLEAQREFVLRSPEAIELFQGLAALYPDLPDAWLGLGEAYFHLGNFGGLRSAEARPAFDRLAALDSTFAPIHDHLIEIALATGDSARARRHLARLPREAGYRAAYEAAVSLRFGDRAARRRGLEALRDADRRVVSLLVALFAHERLDLELADTLAGLLATADRTPDDRLRGAQYRLAIRAASGRWSEGLAAWSRAGGGARFDPWIVHADLAGLPTGGLAAPMYAWADSLLSSGRAPRLAAALPVGDAETAFFALVHRAALRGDSSQVRRLLGVLDGAAPTPDPADPLPASLRSALQARLHLLAADTVPALRLLDGAARRPLFHYWYQPMLSMAPERLLLARLHAARGADARALETLRSFDYSWYLSDLLYQAVAPRRPG